MAIKQQGGIFGRNPTFNDVDIEGTLTVNGEPISDFGSMAQQDADSVNIDGGAIDGVTLGTNSAATEAQIDNVNINGNTIKATDTNGNLIINPDGTSGVVLTAKTRTGITQRTLNKTMNEWGGQGNGAGFENTARYEITAGNDTVKAFLAAGYNSAGKYPNVGAVGTTSNHPLAIHINDSKVAEFTTSGNLAFNNGLGIDFSATAGTGTSELFDDYEEGTWTPTQGGGTTVVGSFSSSGTYTKIGRVVTLNGEMSGSTSIALASVGIIATGLPFPPSGTFAGSMTTGAVDVSNTALVTATSGGRVYATEAISATASAIYFTALYEV